ncbi:Ran-binding-domain-containing protein [Teratosphaeria nubilosa]|uniref:Ran-binding-domain-containing protein n=1 Tax=Teratosphaeria nubilosa TaxID=161662 RepID=A0A6G1L4Z3_9PEZI|nr:Ran-binding-domain-containing protein [Teratosphaeria nubilosa]
MESLLAKVTAQAMNYAIRSGITITTTYAIKQCGRLLQEAPRSKEREELMRLQVRLDSKIRIISPSIDMIELISARGNTTLESAVTLTKEIRYDIQRLGKRLNDAANEEELLRRKSSRAKSREENEREMKAIITAVKELLVRIEDAVPLINLAITTSGVNLSTKMSGTISPSRLLQASTFLTAADTKYMASPGTRQQIGPTYTLSMYMLFAGHARPADEEGIRQTTWKEVIHKARVKLMRVPLDQTYALLGEPSSTKDRLLPGIAQASEFAYQLVLVEDLDDDRVHTFEDGEAQPSSFDDVPNAGVRDLIPVHEISKIFYADTGKILNIGGDGDVNNPVLLIKRDVHAKPPWERLHRSEMGRNGYYDDSASVNGDVQSEIDAQFDRESPAGTPQKKPSHARLRLPLDLDPEWIAFEVYNEEEDSETEDDEPFTREASLDPELTGALSKLKLRGSTSSPVADSTCRTRKQTSPVTYPAIKTTLSLLEMLIKLTSLQQLRQDSHLAIEDELLNFFLEDSSTAGAMYGKEQRQRMRNEAARRVGFDPYDESPVKRRGEQYIQHARGAASPRPGLNFDSIAIRQPGFPHDDNYGYDDQDDEQHYIANSPHAENGITPSSPSPQIQHLLRQTPSRSSTPSSVSSEKHVMAVQAKYGMVRSSPVTTPSSAARSRQALLRAQTEQRARSPLAKEIVGGSSHSDGGGDERADGDSTEK